MRTILKKALISLLVMTSVVSFYSGTSFNAAATETAASPALTHTVQVSRQTMVVNGVETAFSAYAIDGYNYFKLRDIAFVLNGTDSQFSVGYDAVTISCTKGAAYTAVGGEMELGKDLSATLREGNMALFVDGKFVYITAFNLGENNYFKLRELGAALNFNVDYNPVTDSVLIDSTPPTVEKGPPIGRVYFYASLDAAICTDIRGAQIVKYPVNIYKDDTIADAITTLHQDAFGDKTAWGYEKNAVYGDVLNKFWGEDCGNMAYGGGIWTDFSFGRHADLKTVVSDGMIIYLNNFTGSLYYETGYFDKQFVTITAGSSLDLTFKRCSGDGIVKTCPLGAVLIDGIFAGTADSNANISLAFSKAGIYVVTGAANDSYGLAICYVVVK